MRRFSLHSPPLAKGGGRGGRFAPGSTPPSPPFARGGERSQRKLHKHRTMRHELISLVHLHLAQTDAAAGAPGHGIVTAINQAAVVALLQERPDGVIVLIRHREV